MLTMSQEIVTFLAAYPISCRKKLHCLHNCRYYVTLVTNSHFLRETVLLRLFVAVAKKWQQNDPVGENENFP